MLLKYACEVRPVIYNTNHIICLNMIGVTGAQLGVIFLAEVKFALINNIYTINVRKTAA